MTWNGPIKRRLFGEGPGGYCKCPHCGHREQHTTGVPCVKTVCPNCNKFMLRELL